MTTVKQKLLDEEDRGWRELSARFHRVAEGDWLRPGVNGDWTAKDMLAHIAAWLACTADRFESMRATGTLPTHPDPDTFNDEQHRLNRDLALHDVQAMLQAARHRFREEMQLFDDDPGEILPQVVHGNAHGHYEEHIVHLDAFLGV